MMALSLFFPVMLALVMSVLAEVFLGIWVYRDAKARGLNAALWVVVALLVPSFIGLIIYLVVGRNQSTGLCPSCSKAIQPNVKYCPSCGGAVGTANGDPDAPAPKPIPRTGKGMLIAFIVCIALILVGIVAYAVLGFYIFNINRQSGEMPRIMPNISIGSVENHTSRNWHMSFSSLDGEKDNSQLQYDGQNPPAVHVKSSLESGKLELVLTQGEKQTSVDLSSPQVVMDIDLSGFEPGVIDMKLVAESARDGNVEVWWD